MNERHFAGFEYRGLNNLGDNIQSIAVERLLPEVMERFNRDTLSDANPAVPMSIIMNGWFSYYPQTCLPFSKMLHPVFWGFHITDWNDSWKYFSQRHIVEYLKLFEPIGCREAYTANRLADLGLDAFVTYCLTLTFPMRECRPVEGKIFVVDMFPDLLPEEIQEQSCYYSHILPGSRFREAQKRMYARELLMMYQKQARLVITTRLHSLLPCIAMGIPVVFFGNPNDYRISWVTELGVKINTFQNTDEVDWNPAPISFEDRKSNMIKDFKTKINSI